MTDTLLDCRAIEAGYGASQVLFGIDLSIRAGQVVSMLGRNGMGKSTTLKTLVGSLVPLAGSVSFAGQSLAGFKPDAIARLGMALVPEGRRLAAQHAGCSSTQPLNSFLLSTMPALTS